MHSVAAGWAGNGAQVEKLIGRLGQRLAGLPSVCWCALAFGIVAVQGLLTLGGDLAQNLGDTDDATRLVQVRDLIAGAPWFDTTIFRLGGAGGLLSHWSRLIDAPLALLMLALGSVLGMANAEIFVRAVWPLLMLAPLMAIVHRTVERNEGPLAAGFAMLFAATAGVALMQFQIGRIDHHNAQILGAAGAVLLLWACPHAKHSAVSAGRWAGVLAGLSVAVGYEGLPLVAIAAATASLWAVLDARLAPAVKTFALTLLATLVVCFVATSAPSRWLDVRCDALSANLLALLGAGVLGLVYVLGPARGSPLTHRLIALSAAGAAGLALYGLLQPACLMGPFAQTPAELKPLWLDNVVEGQSIGWYLRAYPREAVASMLFLLAGSIAQALLWRSNRQPAQLFLTAVTVLAVLLGCWQIKYIPYATWLVIPPLAIWVARARGTPELSTGIVRLAGLVLLNQWTMLALAGVLATHALGDGRSVAKQEEKTDACFKASSVAALGVLPRGLIVADIDLGPYIAATTHHSALAAPYHRIGAAILDTHWIFAGPLDDARARLARTGAAYLVSCPGLRNPAIPTGAGNGNLAALLERGEAPTWLRPVALPAATPLRAWRVVDEVEAVE